MVVCSCLCASSFVVQESCIHLVCLDGWLQDSTSTCTPTLQSPHTPGPASHNRKVQHDAAEHALAVSGPGLTPSRCSELLPAGNRGVACLQVVVIARTSRWSTPELLSWQLHSSCVRHFEVRLSPPQSIRA